MNFFAGDVIKVFYFLTLSKYRKMFHFLGLCTKYNIKTKTFTLKNFYGPEFVSINFLLNSPNIVKIDKITSYNFFSKTSKFKNKKKFRLIGKTDLITEKYVEKKENPLRYFYKSRNIASSEKKRLRNKFRL